MTGIGCFIAQLLSVYVLILFVRIILSFVTQFRALPSGLAPVMRVIYDLTEPVLGFARRYIPPIGMLDLSPLVVFILIRILQGVIC
ncbi:MAG: YggT family protein [Actinomycetota bacterium]